MNEPADTNRHILVIANPPCPCPALVDEVAQRAAADQADVMVVAPALNSRLRHLVSDVDAAVVRADERARLAVSELQDRGVNVRGTVGDTDPVLAIEDALADYPATEIVIATHARADAHWLERRLIPKATARFAVPITQFVAES
jgi:hypothetical protein